MAGMRNYETGLYKQLEDLNKKLDKMIIENKNQYLTIYELNTTVKSLQQTINKLEEQNKKLIEENEKLKNQNNKNSNNSSKPSSTNYTTPKKKTGANQYNYRVKSNQKIGGQFGHKGNNLSKKDIEKLIDENKAKVVNVYHTINGDEQKEDIIKYRIELQVTPVIEKHIFRHSKKSNNKLPKEFYTDVTYGNSIKSIAIHLDCYNVIAYDRLNDFFKVITNDVINISNGTLVNFLYEFGMKSERTLEVLETEFLNGTKGYTDETETKFNGKNIFIRNYSTEDMVIYKAHKNKGHKPVIEDNILPRFLGGIMGDHDTTLYSYGTKNYECNIHLGRYLMELMENIPDIKWPLLMYDLIFRMNNTRKIAIEYKLEKFDNEKIEEYKKEYDEILELAIEENKQIKSSYYKKKAKSLYNRLKKYKENHLYFIEDFHVPFDDNLSELDLRIFKNKTKISGGFRSMKSAEYFVNTLSIIKTSIKRNINPYESIRRIFNNEVLFIN